MPRGDGTGPMGLGSMTGRAAGYCSGYSTPGFANAGTGRRAGFGLRRGYKNPYCGAWGYSYSSYPYASEITSQEEKQILKNEAERLKARLKDLQNRMDSFENNDTK